MSRLKKILAIRNVEEELEVLQEVISVIPRAVPACRLLG